MGFSDSFVLGAISSAVWANFRMADDRGPSRLRARRLRLRRLFGCQKMSFIANFAERGPSLGILGLISPLPSPKSPRCRKVSNFRYSQVPSAPRVRGKDKKSDGRCGVAKIGTVPPQLDQEICALLGIPRTRVPVSPIHRKGR